MECVLAVIMLQSHLGRNGTRTRDALSDMEKTAALVLCCHRVSPPVTAARAHAGAAGRRGVLNAILQCMPWRPKHALQCAYVMHQGSAFSSCHLMLFTQQVGVTRDAATVDAIFDRITRVAVASRSLRCLGSCALNLCRCGFGTPYDWHHCSMLSCTGIGLLDKICTIMLSSAVHNATQLHKPSMHVGWLLMP